MDVNPAEPGALFPADGARIEALRAVDGGKRVSVVVAGRKAAALSAEGAARLGLRVGHAWSASLADAVDAENAFDRALHEAIRFLARRARSAHELAEHLARKGHAPSAAARAQRQLEAAGALDDRRLAEGQARILFEDRAVSAAEAKRRLEARGLGQEIAAQAASGRDDASAALNLAREHARRAASGDPLGALRRALGALARRGYDEETALDAARRAFADVGLDVDALANPSEGPV